MPLSFTRDSRAAATPAVAGHQPLLLAVAVAACFSVPLASRAQPAGAQAIHGAAALAQQGNKLVVTTQNGAGTSHSAINWQSFSVPTGSVTQFNQPSAASTSINRVLGNNPSAILGTLTSNGKLVLVNPAGIAVGAGAIVDTAGFTASTLRMSDADALAGRMRFEGGGSALAVGGQILARNGDIVLIAPNVDTASSALIQSPNGATIIAAGQKVELTGRGLEGIKLEMQAPQDSAVNLGTLTGDAVGIFAGTLRHSGLISATAATSEGGKVVLKGGASLEIGGHVAAAKGSLGGQVHATASKVKLKSGAVIDVSGAHGGGEALIGGGWQGADASIANAQQTIAETASTINADATQSGKGGMVVLWSDGYTNAAANITARGGVQGGAGGMVETSGKQTLVTSAAPMVHSRDGVSPHGQWLLDPESLTIVATLSSPPAQAPSPSTNNYESGGVASEVTSATLATALNSGANVVLYTSGALGTVSFNDSVLSAPTADAALQVYAHGGITLGANTIGIAAGPPPAGKLSILLQAGYDKGAGAPSAGGGVIISGGGSLVSNGGTITLAGQGSGGTYDVEVQGGISSGGGEVKFMADRLHVNAPVSAGSGTNARIHMLPSVNNLARSLALGTAADTSTALGSAELSFLTARVLVVGQGTGTGNITIADNVSLGSVSELSLIAGSGGISATPVGGPPLAPAKITVGKLNVDAAGAIALGGANDVTFLSGVVGNGGMTFNNAGTSLTIDVADNINGITRRGGVTGGDISINSQFGGMTVTRPITAQIGTLTLTSPGGPLQISDNVSAGTGSLSLSSGSGISLGSGKTLAGVLGVTLAGGGSSINLGSGTVTSDGLVSLSNASSVTLGSVGAAAGTLSLVNTGSVSQNNVIDVGGLSANNSGSIVLGNTSNKIGTILTTMSTGGGSLTLVDSTGGLNINVPVNAGAGAVDIRTTGGTLLTATGAQITGTGVTLKSFGASSDIDLGASINAGAGNALVLDAGRHILLNAGSSMGLTAGSLTATSVGAVKQVQGDTSINVDMSTARLEIAGGNLGGSGNITVTNDFLWAGGTLGTSAGTLSLQFGATGTVNNTVQLNRTFSNTGTTSVSGAFNTSSTGIINNGTTGTMNLTGTGTQASGLGAFNNLGTLEKTAGPVSIIDLPYTNQGPSTLQIDDNRSLQFVATRFTQNSGVINLVGTNSLLDVGGSFTNNASGSIRGKGTFQMSGGTLTNNGNLVPGGAASIGQLTIGGVLNQSATGKMTMEINGAGSTHDSVYVGGYNATLAGAMDIDTGTYQPTSGITYGMVSSSGGSVSGAMTVSGGAYTYSSAPAGSQYDVTAQAAPAPGPAATPAPTPSASPAPSPSPSPPPSPSPSPSPSPTPAPSASPAPSPAPTPGPSPAPTAPTSGAAQVEAIVKVLGGSADAETVATVTRALEETQDTLATFTKLVLKEAASQDEEKKKARSLGEGIAVTDNACTPG